MGVYFWLPFVDLVLPQSAFYASNQAALGSCPSAGVLIRYITAVCSRNRGQDLSIYYYYKLLPWPKFLRSPFFLWALMLSFPNWDSPAHHQQCRAAFLLSLFDVVDHRMDMADQTFLAHEKPLLLSSHLSDLDLSRATTARDSACCLAGLNTPLNLTMPVPMAPQPSGEPRNDAIDLTPIELNLTPEPHSDDLFADEAGASHTFALSYNS